MGKGKDLTTRQVAIKSLLTFSIPLLIILCVVPGPGGKPIMSPMDFIPDSTTLLQAKRLIKILIPKPPEKPMYKWQDTDGSWKISETVPEHALQSAPLNDVDDSSIMPSFGEPKTRIVYRWQDKHGNWHFSETVPEEAKKIAEPITISSDINTITMPKPDPESEQGANPQQIMSEIQQKMKKTRPSE